MNGGYDYPSKLNWSELPDDVTNYCCVTIPSNFFEPSSCNLSQLKVGTKVERKFTELLLFLINCFNNPKIGTQDDGSSDMYFSFEEYSAQNNILLDGENASSTLPKYKIYMEFLAKDIGTLTLYDHENIEGLSKIFSEDNFCGIRFWFIFFDPKYDIHSAIKHGIYKNQERAIIKHLKTQKWPKQQIAKFLKARKEQDNKGILSRGTHNSIDIEGDGTATKPRKSTYVNGYEIDWRAICEQVNIQSKDMNHYHLGINTFKKFGTLVDLIRNEFKCTKLNSLDDKYFDIENNNPNTNPLHVFNWGSFGCGRQFIRRRIPDNRKEDEDISYYEYFISREQNDMGNYFIENDNDDEGFSFKFPFPNLTWSLRPEFCNVKQMLKRDFPWKNISRFDILYQEIMDKHSKRVSKMKLEKKKKQLENIKKAKKNVTLTENGQTEEEERTMLKLNKLKESFYNESSKNEENFELKDELVEYLEDSNYILDEKEIQAKKSLNSSNLEIIQKNGTTIFEELGKKQKEKKKKLTYVREICPEKYPEMMKLYLEEGLAEFVKIYKPETEGMSDSVKSILMWFKNEEKIVRVSPNKSKYKSLALEFNTMDLCIGRNAYNFISNQLYLDGLVPIASIHRNFFAALKSCFYVYVIPSRAKEDIGTSLKPAIFQLGAPGTSKSFLLDLLKFVLIDGTVTNLDGFTDKAFQSGDTNLTDVVALLDEMGSTFTQDPKYMKGDQLERYRNMKTYLTAGKHQRIVCNFEDNVRETKTIKTNVSMTLVGCANSLHTGSESALYDRGSIMISSPMKRVDKNPISLMCTTYSDVTEQNREVLFVLKHRVTQYLFCEIAKMLGSLVIPIKVNIEIGKILKSNTIKLLSEIFIGLDKKIRNSQKLLVNMVTQAILDAIDVCYFSEASPFMIRDVDGRIKYVEFSHKQVQSIMPALCLSEDSAIREILSWLQNELYNDFTYKSLVYTAQALCGFQFYKPSESEDLKNYTLAYMEDNEIPKTKEMYTKTKEMIAKSVFLPEGTREDYKKYSDSSIDTIESIMGTKYFLRMERKEVGVKQREIFYYDTNYIQIPCNSEKDFKKKWFNSIFQSVYTTNEVIDMAYKKASNIMIRGLPRRVYKQTVDNTRTPVIDEEEEDQYHGFYKPNNYYNFKALKFEANINNPSKSKMLISVEFLYSYSLNNILNLALRSMSHKHSRERNIVISKLVEGTPHLYQIYRLIPNEDITLIIENPNHMDEHLSDIIFSQTDDHTRRNMCKSRKSEYLKYDYDLEEEIFVQHAKDCGITDKDMTLKMFVPSNINRTIIAYHNTDINLKNLKKIDYPMTFVASNNRKRKKEEQTMMKQYKNTGFFQFGDFAIRQDVKMPKDTNEDIYEDINEFMGVDDDELDDYSSNKSKKFYVEEYTPGKVIGNKRGRPKTSKGKSEIISLKTPRKPKRKRRKINKINTDVIVTSNGNEFV